MRFRRKNPEIRVFLFFSLSSSSSFWNFFLLLLFFPAENDGNDNQVDISSPTLKLIVKVASIQTHTQKIKYINTSMRVSTHGKQVENWGLKYKSVDGWWLIGNGTKLAIQSSICGNNWAQLERNKNGRDKKKRKKRNESIKRREWKQMLARLKRVGLVEKETRLVNTQMFPTHWTGPMRRWWRMWGFPSSFLRSFVSIQDFGKEATSLLCRWSRRRRSKRTREASAGLQLAVISGDFSKLPFARCCVTSGLSVRPGRFNPIGLSSPSSLECEFQWLAGRGTEFLSHRMFASVIDSSCAVHRIPLPGRWSFVSPRPPTALRLLLHPPTISGLRFGWIPVLIFEQVTRNRKWQEIYPNSFYSTKKKKKCFFKVFFQGFRGGGYFFNWILNLNWKCGAAFLIRGQRDKIEGFKRGDSYYHLWWHLNNQ